MPRFEEITKHLLDRTIELTREMLADAREKGYTRFDKIILVGGATRMPQIHDRLVAEFNVRARALRSRRGRGEGGRVYALKESLLDQVQDFLSTRSAEEGEPSAPVDLSVVSEEQVAEALDHLEKELGFTLTGPVRELVNTRIVNVLSKSLGVVARDDEGREVVVYLLPRNAEVPLDRTTDFGTDAENQSAVDIRVMSGERDSADPAGLPGGGRRRARRCPTACRPAARSG